MLSIHANSRLPSMSMDSAIKKKLMLENVNALPSIEKSITERVAFLKARNVASPEASNTNTTHSNSRLTIWQNLR